MAETTAPDILREFLVRLGWDVDDAGMRKFGGAVLTMTANVVKLGAALQGVAATVMAGATVFASRMEDLYYASQRTGASASNIMAFRFALGQMGGSAEMASHALESLGSFMRSVPNAQRYLQALGVETVDPTTGKMRDMTDIAEDLGQKFAAMPFYIAKARAALIGWDEQMLLVMERGGLRESEDQYKKMVRAAGLDPDQLAKDSHTFQNQMRSIRSQFGLLGESIEAAIVKHAGPQLEQFRRWFSENTPRISKAISELLTVILRFAEWLLPKLMDLLDWFIKMDEKTGGLSTKIILLLGAFKLLGGPAVLGGVFSMFGSLTGAMTGATTAAAGLLAVLSKITVLAAAGWVGWEIGKKLNEKLEQTPAARPFLDWVGSASAHTMAALGSEEARAAVEALDPYAHAVKKLREMGWAQAHAEGIAANLRAESNFNPTAVGDKGAAYGIAQWHKDRQQAFAKWAGHDIRSSNLDEQLAFLNYELTQGSFRKAGEALRRTTEPAAAARVVSLQYERPAGGEREAERRGQIATGKIVPFVPGQSTLAKPIRQLGEPAPLRGGAGTSAGAPAAAAPAAPSVTLNQSTEIRVEGAGDPAAVGQAVAREQNSVNARLQRNLVNRTS